MDYLTVKVLDPFQSYESVLDYVQSQVVINRYFNSEKIYFNQLKQINKELEIFDQQYHLEIEELDQIVINDTNL